MLDDPLSHALHITLNTNTQTSRYIRDLVNDVNDVKIALGNIKLKVTVSESNTVTLDKTINPDLFVHEM